MKGEDVLVRGSYKFHVRKYHAQPKFANGTTKQRSDDYTINNSNLGGKTLKGRTFHIKLCNVGKYNQSKVDSRLY